MSETLSKMVASLNELAAEQGGSSSDRNEPGLDELVAATLSRLLDLDIDAGEAGLLLRRMIEAFVDRFRAYPFDVSEALTGYLALRDYPEEEMRELVKRLQKLYKKRYGVSMRKSGDRSFDNAAGQLTLDDEISQLRETLKYAAIVGEHQDG